MGTVRIEASQEIEAPPEAVYAVLADYRGAHPHILPKPYFAELVVEEGGRGAGTVMRVRMEVMGQTYRYHLRATEPEPGRILVETDIDTGQFTRFTVDPLEAGKRARVTIYTEMPASPGLKGLLEQIFTPMVTRGIYRKELNLLAEYVRR